MGIFGVIGLLVAFAGIVVSAICIIIGSVLSKKGPEGSGAMLLWGGHIATILTFAGLTFCCVLLVFCFVSGDNTIQYVVSGRSHASGALGTFYRVAGLWEGREGSLLFWAWLMSVFNLIVAIRNMKRLERIDSMALLVSQLVLVCFLGSLLFSENNSPFIATAAKYLNPDGSLNAAGSILGMNSLLEHWAMAVHPPALFIGYAGLAIPFAYAIAALIVNDSSDVWVRKCQRYTMVSWFFLGIGIGLGAIWAYVVLGWGGYWGWDAVENASLFPWLIGVALIHSFTVYRRRGAFKRWSIMCACLTFAFVITGTFISRSGLVQSVHAFEGDALSLVLFGALIAASLLAGIVGIVIRWKSFAPKDVADESVDNIVSRDAAYYFNNVIMVVITLFICYLTLSSALPSFLPFGGQAISAGTYNAVARPLGVLYCLVLAICPMLGWSRTDRADFLMRAKAPGICAAILFVLLMVFMVADLWPAYDATIAAGGSSGTGLASEGPAWYYKGLSAVGFAVASIIFFNTLFKVGRATSEWARAHGVNPFVAFFKMMNGHASTYGGYLAHIGIAVILVGLIGSSMFVTEKTGYISYDSNADTAADFNIRDYTLKYTGSSIVEDDAKANVYYTVEYDVYRGGAYIGHVAPTLQLVEATQQTKSNAAVIGFPEEDLFVVYKGVNTNGAFSMNVRVNPLIRFVWAGFALLMLGALLAGVGRRGAGKADRNETVIEGAQGDVAAAGSVDPENARDETA